MLSWHIVISAKRPDEQREFDIRKAHRCEREENRKSIWWPVYANNKSAATALATIDAPNRAFENDRLHLVGSTISI
jgi:hypothetical protein